MTLTLEEAATISRLKLVAAIGLVAVLVLLTAGSSAGAQSLMVLPVNVHMVPGQGATILTVVNEGKSETAIQIRAYAWNQPDGGDDQLTASDAVIVSPPLASIAAGGTQVVRLVLRKPPQGKEATYRIVLDQIPPPAEPGVVRVVLRLSIPVFAQPATRTAPHVQFRIERDGGQAFLVGFNDGNYHEAVRNIVLTTSNGHKLKTGTSTSPYILAGATRRWPIDTQSSLPLPNESFRLTAHEDTGAIEEQVQVASVP